MLSRSSYILFPLEKDTLLRGGKLELVSYVDHCACSTEETHLSILEILKQIIFLSYFL